MGLNHIRKSRRSAGCNTQASCGAVEMKPFHVMEILFERRAIGHTFDNCLGRDVCIRAEKGHPLGRAIGKQLGRSLYDHSSNHATDVPRTSPETF
jgi:hypothetical protein